MPTINFQAQNTLGLSLWSVGITCPDGAEHDSLAAQVTSPISLSVPCGQGSIDVWAAFNPRATISDWAANFVQQAFADGQAWVVDFANNTLTLTSPIPQ